MAGPETLNVENELIAVRAVTAFVVLEKDPSTWSPVLDKAIGFTAGFSGDIMSAGYKVQTLRVITNPFGEYLDTSSLETALAGVDALQRKLKSLEDATGTRIRFSIGAATNLQELRLVPELIKFAGDLANCCINIPCSEDNIVDLELVTAAAEVCETLGRETPRGEGNFNWTINFNGPKLCPYFPAGCNTRENGESFVLGLEYPDLLVSVLEGLVPEGGSSIVSSPATRGNDWAMASTAIKTEIERHVSVLATLANKASESSGRSFAGIDSSPAPSKSVQSMCRVIELLGVEHFGASGTTEACAFLTRIFKSVDGAPLVGFSGLMFACLEDEGLAKAAQAGHYDIRALLTYSAVCGIGLDTVPIPGNTSTQKIAQLACDCGTLAFRLNKPLTVRLFPLPGFEAGDMTSFESSDLCNCTVFEVS
ncbi:hypothetical protein CYMTET_54930 [Cymbomonas tetramitiformis]|uniref:DUF711 family protein n=1 Tax=Cymbomonas tetramitiformis TaxID=36881 RepID=A0AAE0EN94_9CHLO|nr:hypothetical protein CYMTET_54930 [Cymbomonas tetramitiformis]|eukprot:gene14673-17337_t